MCLLIKIGMVFFVTQSPISELSDSEASSPSPGVARRRRSLAKRTSAVSSDEESSRPQNTVCISFFLHLFRQFLYGRHFQLHNISASVVGISF